MEFCNASSDYDFQKTGGRTSKEEQITPIGWFNQEAMTRSSGGPVYAAWALRHPSAFNRSILAMFQLLISLR